LQPVEVRGQAAELRGVFGFIAHAGTEEQEAAAAATIITTTTSLINLTMLSLRVC